MIRKSKSLTARILFFSGIWTVLALAGTAYVLLGFYRSHIEEHYDAHVTMHMEELVGSASLREDGTLSLAYPPSDPRYDIRHSGWYWEVRHGGRVLARSPSLEGGQIVLPGFLSADMSGVLLVDGPAGESLRVQTRQVSNGRSGESLLLVASAPATNIQEEVSDISEHLLASFVLLALGFLIAMAIQIRIALRPMRDISESIHNVDMGRAERVSGEFPRDVQPLVNELNHLLDHNAILLRRARDQLGDLAHAIKNPLTVIDYEAREMRSERGALIRKQAADIAESVKHHLSRARVFGGKRVIGSRCRVKATAEDLEYALERIYKGRALEFDLSELLDIPVRCECQDLEEVLGNLMDNACKWAKKRVVVRSTANQGRVLLYIEDDGPGIPEEDMERVVKRGLRLDETREGTGLGLGIVKGIVEIYDGSLVLSRSRLGGLCATVDLPQG